MILVISPSTPENALDAPFEAFGTAGRVQRPAPLSAAAAHAEERHRQAHPRRRRRAARRTGSRRGLFGLAHYGAKGNRGSGERGPPRSAARLGYLRAATRGKEFLEAHIFFGRYAGARSYAQERVAAQGRRSRDARRGTGSA